MFQNPSSTSFAEYSQIYMNENRMVWPFCMGMCTLECTDDQTVTCEGKFIQKLLYDFYNVNGVSSNTCYVYKGSVENCHCQLTSAIVTSSDNFDSVPCPTERDYSDGTYGMTVVTPALIPSIVSDQNSLPVEKDLLSGITLISPLQQITSMVVSRPNG